MSREASLAESGRFKFSVLVIIREAVMIGRSYFSSLGYYQNNQTIKSPVGFESLES